jgi:hypothetical protein
MFLGSVCAGSGQGKSIQAQSTRWCRMLPIFDIQIGNVSTNSSEGDEQNAVIPTQSKKGLGSPDEVIKEVRQEKE